MNRTAEGVIFLCAGFMAFIWRYAWANYLTIAGFHRPFPPVEAVITLGLGALLVFISFERGWRIIWIVCLQVLGFALAFARMIYGFHELSLSFFHPQWIAEFAGRSKGLIEWLTMIFLLIWTLIFWFGGWLLVRRPRTYFNICTRFDIGLSSVLGLFLVKYIIWYKGGPEIPDPFSGAVIVPFFLFSLLAIALARNRSEARREYLPGYRGSGVILGFIMIVLFLGAGLVSFLLPYLTIAAKAGYGVMKIAAEPLGSVLVGILRFIFGSRQLRSGPAPSSTGGGGDLFGPAAEPGWWAGPLGEIVRVVLLILMGLLVCMFLLLLLWLLMKWLLPKFRLLFSRTSPGKREPWDLFSLWKKIWAVLYHLIRGSGEPPGDRGTSAVRLYADLLKWGRRSGTPRFRSETPLEFGSRLAQRFPALTKAVTSIIDLYNLEIYGGVKADARGMAAGIRARHQLRSPVHWFRRGKVRLFSPTFPLR